MTRKDITNPLLAGIRRVHFTAVCGTGMGSLAGMMKSLGLEVTGSDTHVYPPMSTFLQDQGIPVFEGFSPSNLEPAPDLVIIGNAMSRGNPEVEAVLDADLRYASLPEALKEFFLRGKDSMVAAGTHGKTTTTSLLAWVLESAGRDPGLFVGGIPQNFGKGFKLGSGREFVVEGDEYDSAFFDKGSKFLHYRPKVAILTNIEFDHADIFDDFESVKTTFRRFVNIIPRNGLLLGWDADPVVREMLDRAFCQVQTFGMTPDAHWSAYDLAATKSGVSFRVKRRGEDFGAFHLPMSGEHNVRNALAAIGAAAFVGVGAEEIAEALETFEGIQRRLQLRGEVNDILVFDDFAHHPTEVAATLSGMRQRYPHRRLRAVFEPRTSTAKRNLFQARYVEVFEDADEILLAPLHLPEKVPAEARLSVVGVIDGLRARGKTARACGSTGEIIERVVEGAAEEDVVLVMSNGGFDNIHERILVGLRERFGVESE